MELRRYLQVVLRRWKLVAVVALATTVFTGLIVSGQAPVFESSGTYVVRPRVLGGDEAVDATEALNRGAETISTYARVARSDIVKGRAKQVLQAAGVSTGGLSVRSTVLPGTNIIEIGATGGEPDAVTAYATAVGQETAAYLDEIGEVFLLQELDTPEAPKGAEGSNENFTIALGVILGLGAGSVLAFGIEYASEKPEQSAMNIRDATTGAYSEGYFRLRLRQEMSRCNIPSDLRSRPQPKNGARKKGNKRAPKEKTSRIFTLGMMTVHSGESSQNGSGPPPAPIELRDAAQTLMSRLRFQDVLAYVGDDTFALICPDLPASQTEKTLREWNTYLSAAPSDGGSGSSMYATVKVCQADSLGLLGDEDSMRDAYEV